MNNTKDTTWFFEEGLKSGFYSGQAMAGVELEECHKNWKKWNTPKPPEVGEVAKCSEDIDIEIEPQP